MKCMSMYAVIMEVSVVFIGMFFDRHSRPLSLSVKIILLNSDNHWISGFFNFYLSVLFFSL